MKEPVVPLMDIRCVELHFLAKLLIKRGPAEEKNEIARGRKIIISLVHTAAETNKLKCTKSIKKSKGTRKQGSGETERRGIQRPQEKKIGKRRKE
ncbi:hypothetical protein Pmani_021839 [Petrolisthes manimaculis]|uniref:Uncharacterized protein n=1 Tax=Petrolisthes manimaculis TaxID=1843537 RepID=A0AAE1PFL4_9EUCA|nr:hypothetical protein Pmani_021839 [Petrolisthes manimaculis]